MVPTPKCLAKLQKILKQQTHWKQLDRYFASQVQTMKGKGYSLQGLLTLAQSKNTLESEERTLIAQSKSNSETDSSFVNLPYDNFDRRDSSDPK